ncbi:MULTISPECIES: cytochrome d ubiquinol oxidase subunit II [Lactococcus]|jgi:cytochrome d oxidase, subunit II (cydB)|uniref:Cytochrome bd-I ubiquinol oxidase subunit 2 apoprotein n=1 Tax=Lactococcus garvieae TaxID=1363 RepID=A0A1I4FAJ1_9LACT|nr:cytochrome d ubiquinol oxidase subunit II [Lactococcus garvieae]MDH7959549.1 cytochrome d ubiquinol oxidase subunit II [Lactococcus garvieae]UKS68158.1 cytochrome d ubiquinol oxidase subunit II [Lactococcus garvieae]UYT09857.1 cytochrome d ubiquinol oxidase subunit II [Lactococcus garvieae]UYT11830.1 cytochrome d ubiquinol oxidase subunit II [Lactococcus garvieae]SFL14948.1 cytochrome bd-I ubiquinol oxidase subunit 2 apoprotein [Lactococcus garvieae]
MSGLQLFWFILIAVLFGGFFFLEGFDFGVGMSVLALARNKREVNQAIATIGPFWDMNEVWLLTAGGAMFASFPYWYASLFSGYYNILLLILACLILRGVTFEFRHRSESEKVERGWEIVLGVTSFFIPFLFGLMFTSMIQGVPMDARGDIYASFTTYVNPLSLVGGVAVALMSFLHGLNYIALKTEGNMRKRANDLANKLYFVLYAGEVVFALLIAMKTDFIEKHAALTIGLLAVIVLLTVFAHVSVAKKREMSAFLSSGLTFLALVALLFQGLFPRVMIAENPAYSILIKDASSTHYTLTTMSYITIAILPFVLAYMAWTYYIFRKRISE